MPSLFLHRISVVCVYFFIAATTQDPAGQDLCQLLSHFIFTTIPIMLYPHLHMRKRRISENRQLTEGHLASTLPFCQILSPCFSLRLLLGLPWWPQRHMSLSDTGIDVWTPERQLVREGSKIIRHIPRKGVSLPSSLPWPHCSYTFPLQAHTTTVVWLALVSPFNIQNEQKGVLCKLHNLVYLSLYLYA